MDVAKKVKMPFSTTKGSLSLALPKKICSLARTED